MESGSNPLFRRSLTTVSSGGNRPVVGTSWLKDLISSGNASPVESPLKSDFPRRNLRFDLEANKSAAVSSWIRNLNSNEKAPDSAASSFVNQLAKSQKSVPISSWISGLIQNAKDTPETKVQKLIQTKSQDLSNWMNDIANQTNPPKDENLKDPLKTAVCNIVDQAFETDDQSQIEEEKPPTPRFVHEVNFTEQVRKRFADKPLNFKQRIKCKRAEEAIQAFPSLLTTKPSNSSKNIKMQTTDIHELGNMSPAYSFNKQRRSLDFAHLQSPGPACYEFDSSGLKKHPAAVFPTDKTARNLYLDLADTPGPACYHPAKHFSSK